MDLKDRSLLGEQYSVGGDWIGAPATAVTDSATGAVIARVPRFGVEETREAIAIASTAREAHITGARNSPRSNTC